MSVVTFIIYGIVFRLWEVCVNRTIHDAWSDGVSNGWLQNMYSFKNENTENAGAIAFMGFRCFFYNPSYVFMLIATQLYKKTIDVIFYLNIKCYSKSFLKIYPYIWSIKTIFFYVKIHRYKARGYSISHVSNIHILGHGAPGKIFLSLSPVSTEIFNLPYWCNFSTAMIKLLNMYSKFHSNSHWKRCPLYDSFVEN